MFKETCIVIFIHLLIQFCEEENKTLTRVPLKLVLWKIKCIENEQNNALES